MKQKLKKIRSPPFKNIFVSPIFGGGHVFIIEKKEGARYGRKEERRLVEK